MEEFVVSARKYRPQTFDEVLGQGAVTATLKNALQKKQIAHAYLFTGPRGVGKTTCARILAKVINCSDPVDGHTACDKCDSCMAFNNNASFNIFELDAASNNSVENIRILIDEQVRYLPQLGKYKVFIIDEVHMLSKAAFNAFLKTLEEPPAHIVFILATTEKQKLLPTILSRCQIYDFKMIQTGDVVLQLERISKSENIAIEKEAIHTIAKKADGAMRDALSVFDRVVSSARDVTITYRHVLDLLNLLDYDYYFKITDNILQGKLTSVYLLFDQILREGFDPNFFILGLAEHYRNLLVAKDPRTHALLETGEELKNRYLNQAEISPGEFLLSALDILNKCDIFYANSQNKRLHVEIALSKLVHLKDVFELSYGNYEKKKPELNASDNSSSGIKQNISEKKDAVSEVKTVEKSSVSSGENSFGRVVSEPGITNVPPSGVFPGSTARLPRIGDLINEIEKEELNRREPISCDILLVERAINERIDSVSSQIVLNVLKELCPEKNDDNLIIYVPTFLAKDILSEEKSLFISIRDHHFNPLMDIDIIVDISKFPEHREIVQKKILTGKEKYDQMNEMNPLLADFVKSFDLTME